MIPAGCLPLRGRKGVALMAPVKEYANGEGKMISKEPLFFNLFSNYQRT
jgi:hypothetical protein